MDKPSKAKKLIKKQDEDDFLNVESVASSTECTGLIQTPPFSIEEAKSYSDIYDVPQTEVKSKKEFTK